MSKVARFWDYLSLSPAHEKSYFSAQAGDAVLRFARQHRRLLRGRVLDFGCGRGFLLKKLASSGIVCEGADFSARAVQTTRERLSRNPFFGGATVLEALPTPFADGAFDVVFLIETIEHLLPQDLEKTINEVHRIMGDGGHLIVTVPNDEVLEAGNVLCPECGCVFHRWQHVSRWTVRTLAEMMESKGFSTVACRTAFLRPGRAWQFLREALSRIRREKMPNLIYVGQKR